MYFLLYKVRSHVPNHTYIHIAPSSVTFCCNTDFSQLERSFNFGFTFAPNDYFSFDWVRPPYMIWYTVSFAVCENHGCKVLFSCWWFLCVVQQFNEF